MAAPYSLENTLRIHDEALKNWLQQFHVDYGTISGQNRNDSPVITVFSAPHRAFAATVDQLVSQGWVQESDPEISRARATYDWPVLPLPVFTIDRDDPIISNELANVPAEFTYGLLNEATGEWKPAPYPIHYLTQYRVTIWSEKKYTHAHFMEWLLSQIGRKGMWQREVLIPVQHAAPWGTLQQALRYLGSANLSDLEGFDARHIRSQLSFNLRTWFMKEMNTPVYGGPPIYATGVDAVAVPPLFPPYYFGFDDPTYVMPADSEFEHLGGVWGTNNLFTFGVLTDAQVATEWPVRGDARVVRSISAPPNMALRGLQVTVDAVTDSVPLTSLLTSPDSWGLSIWSISMYYRATADWALVGISTATDNTATTVFSSIIPAGPVDGTWNHQQVYTICLGARFEWDIAGAATPAVVEVGGLDVRQIFPTAHIPPTSVVYSPGTRYYDWVGLDRNKPYLLVCLFHQPNAYLTVQGHPVTVFGVPVTIIAAPPAASGTLTAYDDAVSATATQLQVCDTPGPVGAVFLMQPNQESLRLQVPSGFSVAAVYALSFDGPSIGNSI